MYSHLPDEDKADWESLKTALGERLVDGSESQACLSQLMQVSMDSNSVAQFQRRIEKLAYDAFPDYNGDLFQDQNDLLFNVFVKGLSPSLQESVINSRVLTFREAVDHAKRLESMREIYSSNSNSKPQPNRSVDTNLTEKLLDKLIN